MRQTAEYVEIMTTARGRLVRQREDLIRQRRALQSDLSASAISQGLEGPIATHQADAASDLFVAEVSAGDIQRIDEAIAEIDAALERIERGTYGICIDCGERIDPARLRARPTAARCLRCQTHYEITRER